MLYQKKNNVLPFYSIFIFFIIKEEASVEYRFDIIDVLLFKKAVCKREVFKFRFFYIDSMAFKKNVGCLRMSHKIFFETCFFIKRERGNFVMNLVIKVIDTFCSSKKKHR
jgi:hypothetical protein